MAKSRSRSRRERHLNDHAEIRVQENREADFGGYTYSARRDDGFSADIHTDSSNKTRMYVSAGNEFIALSGRQARTIQRLLNKHFSELGRSPAILGAE